VIADTIVATAAAAGKIVNLRTAALPPVAPPWMRLDITVENGA
jgi:hypothetical protein